jgi:hypothetical protein
MPFSVEIRTFCIHINVFGGKANDLVRNATSTGFAKVLLSVPIILSVVAEIPKVQFFQRNPEALAIICMFSGIIWCLACASSDSAMGENYSMFSAEVDDNCNHGITRGEQQTSEQRNEIIKKNTTRWQSGPRGDKGTTEANIIVFPWLDGYLSFSSTKSI